MKISLKIIPFVLLSHFILAQESEKNVVFNPLNINAQSQNEEFEITLEHRIQSKKKRQTSAPNDQYDPHILSPKSIKYLASKNKFYIHNLEGFNTLVYDLESMTQIGRIMHTFKRSDSALFKNNERTVFDYSYRRRKTDHNIFSGKPVESTFSHKGKYLWVTYYRRSYDKNAESPSAVAIIDTDTDKIVRVMPTGPLPKMIATSPDNNYVAITHWGDNTIAIVDISSNNVEDFQYTEHFAVGKRLKLDFGDEKVDRDQGCGYCLRGTVFTTDSKYLLVGRMGGGGIAIFDMDQKKYLGTSYGSKSNIRHLVIQDDNLVISTNKTGYIQKTKWSDMIATHIASESKTSKYKQWEGAYVGYGVRTVDVSKDGKYAFACVNASSKIEIVDLESMQKVCDIPADSYPVGMTLMKNDTYLGVTSQGRKGKGGHSVMIYKIITN